MKAWLAATITNLMRNAKLMKCPSCENEMELGFSHRSSPLSYVARERVQRFVHKDEDLNRAGLKTILPSKASYNAAFHCRGCRILVVDYGKPISSQEAKGEAAMVS
jgi:hypothetical protein